MIVAEHSDCDRRFDRRMRIVIEQLEIFELEIVDVLDHWIQFHPRQRATVALPAEGRA